MKTICVYCGSRSGSNPAFEKAARDLGKAFAENEIQLVYGGAKIGIMGAVANGCLDAGGKVTGIQPKFLEKEEVLHRGLTDYISTASMHERKFAMYEKSDAFMVLPGGLGTFDELFEILTWRKLGLHKKPVGVVNIKGYYDRLVQLVQHSVDEQFSDPVVLDHFFVGDDPLSVLELIRKDSNF